MCIGPGYGGDTLAVTILQVTIGWFYWLFFHMECGIA